MPSPGNSFSATADYAAVQTNTQLQAAPSDTNMSLHITDIIISNGATAGQVKIVEDTGGTPVDALENLHFAANGGIAMTFDTPIKLSEGKNLGVTSTTADDFSVTVSGYEGF